MSSIEFYIAFATTIAIIVGTFLSFMIPFIRQTSRDRENSEARQKEALEEIRQAIKELGARQLQDLKDSEARQLQNLNEVKEEQKEIRQAIKDSEGRILEILKNSEDNLAVLIAKNESGINALNVQLNRLNRVVFTLNGHLQRLLGHVFGVKELLQPDEEEIHTDAPKSIQPDKIRKRRLETGS